MKDGLRTLPLLLLAVCAIPVVVHAHEPVFTALVLGPNGYFSPAGVSGDGQVVVGGSYVLGQGNQARRWRKDIGFDYPGPSVGQTATWGSAVSASGSVVCGGSGHAQFGDLEGWVRYGNSAGHVGSPPGHNTSDCLGVSSDGVVVVGYGGIQSNPNLFEAAYYTEQDDWTNLGFLTGGNNSKATACSANGSVIAGWSTSDTVTGSSAFRWTSGTGMVSIGNLAGGNQCTANAVNADGSVIVGSDYVGSNQRAWRWTSSTGMVDLGGFSGGLYNSAFSVSDDGSVVVGTADLSGGYEAFIWDTAHGFRRLVDLLQAQGLNTGDAGWSLTSATCIRGNGPWFICGEGDSSHDYEGWLVELTSLEPSNGTPICLGDGTDATACPCGNLGASGHGCANSAAASNGALLLGWGATQPDQLSLDASEMLPNALCIFLQGDALVTPAVSFGDGLRCAGGHLKRLASRNAVNGAALYPQSGDPSISARSAALGDPIPSGSSRHYQVYYRDPVLAFCAAPSGDSWNVTNGITIQW